jgi:hypothetical protein
VGVFMINNKSNRSSILEGLHKTRVKVDEAKIDEVKTDDIMGMAQFASHFLSNRHGLKNVTLETVDREGPLFSVVVCFDSPLLVSGAIEERIVTDLHHEILGNFIIPMVADKGFEFKVSVNNTKISDELFKVRVIITNKSPISSDIPVSESISED